MDGSSSSNSGNRPLELESSIKGRYLYVQTAFYLSGIDLNDLGSPYHSWNPLKPCDLQEPPLCSRLNFVKAGLPIGMGIFKVGSDIHMIGGERHSEKILTAEERLLENLEDDVQGSCKEVYIFKPPNFISDERPFLRDCGIELADHIPGMNSGKSSPLVEVIQGKIFVHQCQGIFHHGFVRPNSILEVYDNSSNSWKAVDTPYFNGIEAAEVVPIPTQLGYGNLSVGTKIFITFVSQRGHRVYYCFDADESKMTWDSNAASNLKKSFSCAGLPLPLHATCVKIRSHPQSYLMLFLRSFDPYEPYACLIHEDGRILCYQNLKDYLFADVLPFVGVCLNVNFIDLGDGQVCAILFGRTIGASFDDVLLHICFFKSTSWVLIGIEFLPISAPRKRNSWMSRYSTSISASSQKVMTTCSLATSMPSYYRQSVPLQK